jgi:hypothetical protein
MVGEVVLGPECVACGGECCREFSLTVEAETPWMAEYEMCRGSFYLTGPAVQVEIGLWRAPASCSLFGTGGCDESSRPECCLEFPSDAVLRALAAKPNVCLLAERLLRERLLRQYPEV